MQNAAFILVFFITTFTNAVSNGSINYCGARMCGNTNTHTFCQYPEGPSYNCVGYISAGLTDDEKSRVIDRLNRRRNEAAAGRLRRLNSAGNMLKMRWVDELAREAQRWADQCQPPSVPEDHDACRDLYSISVGQCVASVVGEAPGLRVESMVDIWYMQNMLYKGNATIYVPPNRNSSFYGDFAQIMWAESYMVGCGRSRFMTTWQGRLRSVERLVCNVAPRGPPPSRPLWSPSAPATLCPTRSKRDNVFHALCDIHVNPNKINEIDSSMTLEEHLLLYTILDVERNKSINYPGSLDEIYLTRLAIATMKDSKATETYYNSIQRRDIPGMTKIEHEQNNNDTTIRVEGQFLVHEITASPLSHRTTDKIKERKRITLIGRPKPYNMDELTDVDYRTENYLSSEDVTKRRKEFDDEYEFIEAAEDNTTKYRNIKYTSETLSPFQFDMYTTEVITVFNAEYIRNFITNFNENSSIVHDTGINEISLSTDNVNLIHSYFGITKNDVQFDGSPQNRSLTRRDKVDEYLTDPETVQELQEALDRMEGELSTESSTERQVKVRRELRNTEAENIIDDEVKLKDDIVDNQEKNKSLSDKSPMYNMVMKYMPYLKQYDRGLFSAVSNKASHLSLSYLLVLLYSLL